MLQIDHKCNKHDKTVKYYPNRISKEHRLQFKSDKNKHRCALSKIEKHNILLDSIEKAPPSKSLGILK